MNTLGMFSLALCFWITASIDLSYYFLIIGVIFGCGLPFYMRWQQKRNYTTYVANIANDWERQVCKLQIADGYLEMSDNDSWSKLSLKKVQIIHEITPYFFIRLKNGSTIIIPKNSIDDIGSIRKELSELGANFNIPVATDLKWAV